MNRKQFLKRLGLLFGAAIVAPSVLAETTKIHPLSVTERSRSVRGSTANGGEGVSFPHQADGLFPKDLVQFAKWFGKRYKHLSANTKFSPYSVYQKNNFTIQYFDVISDADGNHFKTPARISNKTKEIQLSKRFFTENHEINDNSVFYLILWTWHVVRCDNDLTRCDIETLKYYKQMGLPIKDVYLMWCKTFKSAPSDQNMHRLKKIDKFCFYNTNPGIV